MPVLRHRLPAEGGREGAQPLKRAPNAGNAALLIAPQWIGDAVMSQPLLARLAARGERVTVAALPWVAPVYRAMPEAAEVIELPFAHGRLDWQARRQLAGTLRARFAAAYVLPNSLKSALIPWFARIPRRIGYHGESRFWLVNERLPNPPGRPPMVAFYSALAGEGGAAGDAAEQPRMQFGAELLKQACVQAGVTHQRFFVFAPGAEYGPAKCWPVAHYAALAASLHAEYGEPVLLLGSGKEQALCTELAAAAPGACRVLAGKTSLQDAMALIAAARGVVSNDSGLMHVAAAFGVPQVAVFGSTSPEHTPPLSDRAEVIWLNGRLPLACMPCFERSCRFGNTLCLTQVTPRSVAAALARQCAGRQLPSLPT